MRIALATDHRGLVLKGGLVSGLGSEGHEILDLGSHDETAVDYPDYAFTLAAKVVAGEVDRGILICGTGIGMSIAANKVPGARAALVYDEDSVLLSREHNNANIMILPGNKLSVETALRWVAIWLTTDFAGGRHGRRVEMIDKFASKRDPSRRA